MKAFIIAFEEELTTLVYAKNEREAKSQGAKLWGVEAHQIAATRI